MPSDGSEHVAEHGIEPEHGEQHEQGEEQHSTDEELEPTIATNEDGEVGHEQSQEQKERGQKMEPSDDPGLNPLLAQQYSESICFNFSEEMFESTDGSVDTCSMIHAFNAKLNETYASMPVEGEEGSSFFRLEGQPLRRLPRMLSTESIRSSYSQSVCELRLEMSHADQKELEVAHQAGNELLHVADRIGWRLDGGCDGFGAVPKEVQCPPVHHDSSLGSKRPSKQPGPSSKQYFGNKWEHTEDHMLKCAISKYGNRWKKVAECLAGRTEAMCRNRWQRLHPSKGGQNKCSTCGELKRGHSCLGTRAISDDESMASESEPCISDDQAMEKGEPPPAVPVAMGTPIAEGLPVALSPVHVDERARCGELADSVSLRQRREEMARQARAHNAYQHLSSVALQEQQRGDGMLANADIVQTNCEVAQAACCGRSESDINQGDSSDEEHGLHTSLGGQNDDSGSTQEASAGEAPKGKEHGDRRTFTSRYRGVSLVMQSGVPMFRARCYIGGKSVHIGKFGDELEAAKARDAKVHELVAQKVSWHL